MQGMLHTRFCHHIINSRELLQQGQAIFQKGNLWLGGVGAIKAQIIQQNKIGAVLSILDKTMMDKYVVKEKIEHMQISKQNHKWIDLQDQQSSNISDHFLHAANFIQEKLAQTNVLVHCQVGVSRSASLVISYLMIKHHMSFDKSLELVRQKRQFICPNDAFLKQLAILEQEIQKKQSVKKQQAFDQSLNLNWILNINGQDNIKKGNLFLGGIEFFQNKGNSNPNCFIAIVSVLDEKTLQENNASQKFEQINILKENYRHYDLQLMTNQQVLKSFEESAVFIEEKLKQGNVFVHCKAGISKSSSILIAFIIKSRKITFQQALALAKGKRAKVNPNMKYSDLLKLYQKTIF